MRNRLNMVWNGKRTTARFPDYLWRLALAASGLSDEALADKVKDTLAGFTQTALSASEAVQGYLVNLIELELFAAGFNPGNSCAHGRPGPRG